MGGIKMKIYQVSDPEFRRYGRVITGIDTKPFLKALEQSTPLPVGTEYVPEERALQELPESRALAKSLYGGLPVQFGWCNGHNTKLNCLEYHRDSEFNLGTDDFVLLLAKEEEMEDFALDTECVKAFRVPAGVLVEVYADTLHYAPCHTAEDKGFRVMVVLPKGTNTEETAPEESDNPEDRLLRAANKWLLAHPESSEAASGAWVGLKGENIDISEG